MHLNSYRYFGSAASPEALADETLDAVFAALADSTRRKILARLAEGEASVAELAEPFALSQPAISKHLKVLEDAGLVSSGRAAQRRPRKIEPERLGDASEWLEKYRALWAARYEKLDTLLDELVAREKRPRRGRSRNPKPESGEIP
jgi:DNA-binding transcriptional ArsR family regulator